MLFDLNGYALRTSGSPFKKNDSPRYQTFPSYPFRHIGLNLGRAAFLKMKPVTQFECLDNAADFMVAIMTLTQYFQRQVQLGRCLNR
jgi:hypothetical protein